MARTTKAFAGALLASLSLLAACGSDEPDPSGNGSEDGPQQSGVVRLVIQDFSFSPNELSIDAGDSVDIEITNEGEAPHTFTADNFPVDERLEPGATATVTITPSEEGESEWRCTIHPQMTGTIVVGDGGNAGGGNDGSESDEGSADDLDY